MPGIQQATYAVPRGDLGVAMQEFNPDQPMIALDVLPPLPVEKEAATVLKVIRENLAAEDDSHKDGAAYNRVNLHTEDLAYECLDYGLEAQLTDRQRQKFRRDMDCELETVRNLERKVLIQREEAVETALFNTTTWDSSDSDLFTDNSASPWSTTTTNVISQVLAAKLLVVQNCGYVPNALIIGYESMLNLLKNTVITARFPGAAIVTEQMLRDDIPAVFGIEKLIVGRAVYNTANEGQSFSGSLIWPKTYAMVARVAAGGEMISPGVGRTIVWEDMVNGDGSPLITQYREEHTKSDIFRRERYEAAKIFDAYFGHLLQIEA